MAVSANCKLKFNCRHSGVLLDDHNCYALPLKNAWMQLYRARTCTIVGDYEATDAPIGVRVVMHAVYHNHKHTQKDACRCAIYRKWKRWAMNIFMCIWPKHYIG